MFHRKFIPPVAIALSLVTSPVCAIFHFWSIQEVYTNADGSVQFIELFTTFAGQQSTAGQIIQTTNHTFTFPGNTPTPTNNRHLLLATEGFNDDAGVTPNFTIVENFFEPNGDTINFIGASMVSFTSAPIDGVRSLNYPGAQIRLNTPTNHAGVEGYVPPSGDFDGSGQFDCVDVDALVAEIVAGTHDAAFDLTLDEVVDTADLASWRSIAGASQLPSGNPYLPGDANLNGIVDGSDFGIWNSSKFTSVAAWCSGDFNADGFVDGSDFGIWNSNKFTSSDAIGAVPEPAWLWLASASVLVARRRMPGERNDPQ